MSNITNLFFQTYGPDHAPTLVFLHGGGAAGWMWKPVIDQLPDYHSLTIDLPEQGESQSSGPFSMERAAEETAQIIRTHAHQGKATVIGLSEGAQVAVQLLATAPDVFERAVISSALMRPIPGGKWMTPGLVAWSFRMSVPPFRNNDAWIRLNMKYSAGIPETFFPDFKMEFQRMQESGFVNMVIANQRFRKPAGLENVPVPTLVIAGAKEYQAMKESARDLAATLPNARAMQLNLGPKSSLAQEHNWAMTAPHLFAQTVRAWVEGKPFPAELSYP
jgi:pimeloyl-ACP methyl ester carboxylesterase